MNAKDAIMQIRALFEDMPMVDAPAPAPAPIEEVPVTFAEYSLIDGTKVMISELAIGGQVTLEDGSPAPMGEHQLADGTKIVLDEAHPLGCNAGCCRASGPACCSCTTSTN